MKYFNIDGIFDKELFDRFLKFYEESQEQSITIYLNTGGGGWATTERIIDLLNKHKDATISVKCAHSCGFMLLFYFKGKIELSKSCLGMWHYGRWDVEINDKGKPYYYETECILRNLPFHKRQTEFIARKTMTEKEYAKFKKDENIYFDAKRMKQIFPNAKIIK